MQYSILLILGGTCSATVETWHWYPSFWAAAYFERDNWNSLFRRFNQGWSDWFAFYIVITSDNDPLLAFRELTLVNAIGWIKKKCFTVQFNLNNSDWLRAIYVILWPASVFRCCPPTMEQAPFEIRACSDVNLFKSKLKTFPFKKVYDI